MGRCREGERRSMKCMGGGGSKTERIRSGLDGRCLVWSRKGRKKAEERWTDWVVI
jgi:hypothetical protein